MVFIVGLARALLAWGVKAGEPVGDERDQFREPSYINDSLLDQHTTVGLREKRKAGAKPAFLFLAFCKF
ncbi:hypothetical protein CLV24_10292 [Pontibacter ummariensis]|uniref:Uncharacterized protein n=1 Tax=Pontibacter ummariensis TaxID=1610492 RepID=A0A239C437_9BACT|nr:hypothetical protein CLV24_10292 [Pontibacter ummariensis]SNS14672.1 hypothetical protein SAMN06296052_102321 [Pontibacter ummariensis]